MIIKNLITVIKICLIICIIFNLFSCHLSPQYFIDKQNNKDLYTRLRIEYCDNSYEYINVFDYRIIEKTLYELNNTGKVVKIYKDYDKIYEIENFDGLEFSEEIK
jgi:hypothetical protein